MNASVAVNGAITALMLGWLLLLNAHAVSVDVSPHVAMEPAHASIIVRVPRHPENRGLYVVADGYRSSFVQLDGEFAPAILEIQWAAVPAGDYDITARVVSNTALLASAHTNLRVIGRGR